MFYLECFLPVFQNYNADTQFEYVIWKIFNSLIFSRIAGRNAKFILGGSASSCTFLLTVGRPATCTLSCHHEHNGQHTRSRMAIYQTFWFREWNHWHAQCMIYFAAVSLISSVISAPQTCVVLKPCFLLVLTVYCMPLFCFVDIVDNSGIFIALVSFELTTFNSLKELEEVCCHLILP